MCPLKIIIANDDFHEIQCPHLISSIYSLKRTCQERTRCHGDCDIWLSELFLIFFSVLDNYFSDSFPLYWLKAIVLTVQTVSRVFF